MRKLAVMESKLKTDLKLRVTITESYDCHWIRSLIWYPIRSLIWYQIELSLYYYKTIDYYFQRMKLHIFFYTTPFNVCGITPMLTFIRSTWKGVDFFSIRTNGFAPSYQRQRRCVKSFRSSRALLSTFAL